MLYILCIQVSRKACNFVMEMYPLEHFVLDDLFYSYIAIDLMMFMKYVVVSTLVKEMYK
jgi:hypothetical protein